MSLRTRTRATALVAVAAALLLAAPAGADQAYDAFQDAFYQAGGNPDPCSFTEAELRAALAGIPPQIRDVVPDVRRAIEAGIAAHRGSGCTGGGSDERTAGGVAAPGSATTPTTPTTPAVTTPPATTPAATAPATPPATTPAPAAATTTPAAADDGDGATALLIALVAAGALVLLALALWGWTRMRGWDPAWAARTRHAWGEAGFRTTSTWSEFTDWLRLGR